MIPRLQILGVLAVVSVVGCSPFGEKGVRRDSAALFPDRANDLSARQAVAEAEPGVGLDANTQNIIAEYGSVIKQTATKYGMDWRLVLAIMKQESRFSPNAESHKGARGLMQIMPLTGEEVSEKLGLGDFRAPNNNIRGGIYYLQKLYGLFEGAGEEDRLKLTLAAYNAGIGRVYDAQELAAYISDSPREWQSIKGALPMLSKRYYTLHRSIWGQDRPKSGWFGNARQTVMYVDNVMEYYDEFRTLLN